MNVHVLKVWPEFYWPLLNGTKTAEFRKADRKFAVGDTLILQPWSPKEFQPGVPQGYLNDPAIHAKVSHISMGGPIPEGYAMLSLCEVREALLTEDDAAMKAPGAYGFRICCNSNRGDLHVPSCEVNPPGKQDGAA
jgi:hypothetical protein